MRFDFCRVDERLLHGQITTAWVKHLSISHIFVVDDDLASDRLATKLMSMMVPPQIDVRVLSVEQMVYIYQNAPPELSQKRIMLLFQTLEVVRQFIQCAGRVFDKLNLGGISYRVGRQQIYKNLFLSLEERLIIQNLIYQNRVKVFSQILPGDTPVDLSSLINIK